MVQFKDLFLGLEKREYTRAATAQKCMRVSGKHNDLENVGPSPRHHTFFEMLGNFSFGDYFKQEAIRFAWECLTGVFGLDPDRLYPTVYQDDDEAAAIWQEVTGFPEERITRLGKKDNWWAMGDTGPNGPCSEIIYDRGVEQCTCSYHGQCTPATAALEEDCDRWWELWNLVFMQYNTASDGTTTPLPRPSVDTGMGMERLTAVLQGVGSNYETDLFMPMIRRAQELLGHTDEQVQTNIVAYRVIADHSRAITFLIGDGVIPGNEGRNYVLRMLLRRAARFGFKLGFEEPFLAEIAKTVIETMGHHYRELEDRQAFILTNITAEEKRFHQTLHTGLNLLDRLIADLGAAGETVIPGRKAFELYSTYGFPLDLTRDVAAEAGFTVDEEGYRMALEEERERARAAAHFTTTEESALRIYADLLQGLQEQAALGLEGVAHPYDQTTQLETTVLAILRDGEVVKQAHPGDSVEIVVAATPFYVESGGQVSDTGIIGQFDEEGNPLWQVRVDEARCPVAGLIVHVGEVVQGMPRAGDETWVVVDFERRYDTMRNHTATHLLHSELRYILGEHVQQAGSLVTPERLRFDFTHTAMLTEDELTAVEQSVNDAILANYPVQAEWMSYDEALELGAMALFNEKYGDRVRVIKIGFPEEPFSVELCGGTHVSRTSELGLFHIVSETSIGAGIRRIEAVTGHGAQRLVQDSLARLQRISSFLGVPEEQTDRRVLSLLDELNTLHKEVTRLRQALAQRDFETLLGRVVDVDGVKVLAAQVEATDMETMRQMSDWFRNRLGSGAIVLGAAINGKPSFVAAVTPDLVKRGVHAGALVKEVAQVVGGGGGGKPTLAQAGGRDLSRMADALAVVRPWVERKLARGNGS